MAPAKNTTASEDADMILILNAVASCAEFKLDAQFVAKAVGITHVNNVYPKLHKILKKHGFKYKDQRIMKDEGNQVADEVDTTPPKSARKKKIVENGGPGSDISTPTKSTTKKAKAGAAPLPKKRKLGEIIDAEY